MGELLIFFFFFFVQLRCRVHTNEANAMSMDADNEQSHPPETNFCREAEGKRHMEKSQFLYGWNTYKHNFN